MAFFYSLTLDLNVVMKASSSRGHELQAAMAMLTLLSLSATPNWWDADDFVCLREVRTDTSGKEIDLDVLQAAINLGHRGNKFLRDRASHRVAVKRLYQRHPVNTLCQEGVGKCNAVMGVSFILLFILYQIFSKLQPQVHTARIKSRNRAAVVRAIRADKADHAQVKDSTVTTPSSHSCSVVASDKASRELEGHSVSKDRTMDPSNCENSHSSMGIAFTSPVPSVGVFGVRGNVRYLRAVIRQHLFMSGDVELNPGPLDDIEIERILSTVDDTTFDEDDWNIVMRECSTRTLAAKWKQLGGYLGLRIGVMDTIKRDNPNDSSACWSEALQHWIQQDYNTARFGLPSWRTLLEAIAQQNRRVFKTLAEKHKASETDGQSAREKNAGGATGYQMESGHKKTLEGQMIGQKRKRDDEQEPEPKPRKIRVGPKAELIKSVGVQQIIVSATDIASGESLSELPNHTFHCDNVEGRNKEERKRTYTTLYAESVKIMLKFQTLFSSLKKSLITRNITSRDICGHVECLGPLQPVFKDSGLPVLRQQIPKLRQAETVDDAMSIISGYCSFFNFHILEPIVKGLGSPDDETNLSDYKKEFSEYAKRQVFQCPLEVGTVTSDDAKMFVTLDDTFNKCSLNTLRLLCSDLCEVLNLSPGSGLKLCQIEPGSLKLMFQLPFSLLQNKTIFPLTKPQESALAQLGVEKLWLIYSFNKHTVEHDQDAEAIDLDESYTIEEETGDSASDKSEERTDDFEDNEDDTDAGIDLISLVTGLSIGKSDDASSIADSAIATSIATFTDQVSQYSENLLERDLRDEPYLRMEREAAKLRPPNYSSGLELHWASLRGEVDTVKQLVETENVNPLLKDEDGDTALHWAAEGGGLSVMKFFIEGKGLSPACQGQYGRTALHHAAEFKHLELVQYLVGKQQVDPLCKDEHWGHTSLHTSCIGGDMDVIKFLINEMQNYMSLEDVLNERSKHGQTPFHLAAFHGHFPVIKFFISELNFDPNTPGSLGRPALHHAAQEGHLEVVSYLIEEAKCDPSCCPGEEKETPLHLAAQNGRLDVVRYLTLKHHSNPLSRDSHGNTPLHYAALNGHFKVVAFFVSELNCDPNSPGWQGRRPLHYACQGGSMDIVKYLIEQMNCNASQVDEQQNLITPLYIAALCGHLHIVKYLIVDKLCNPLCCNGGRDTPLHAAAREGHLKVVQYYIQTIQCSLNIRGWSNMTPLEQARSNGHSHVVSYLESLSTK